MANVAFIGLGMMGSPMAAHLIQAGHTLWVKDASQTAQDEFIAKHGCHALDSSAKQLDAEFIITMLPSSKIVESVLDGLLPAIKPGAMVIDMSSSEPLRTRALAAKLAEHGIALIDAPVSGGQKRAITGTLAIMVGGEEAQVERSQPVLCALGKAVRVGPVGAGHALKALNNYASAAALIATVEVMHVGKSFGLDPEVMVDMINNSTGRNNTTENKVKQYMLNGAYNSAFSLSLLAKDVGIAVSLGDELGTPMPLGKITQQVWQEANEEAPGVDHTELYRLI